MALKQPKAETKTPINALDEAITVRTQAFRDIDEADHQDRTKYIDAYARAANVVRQLEKDRKKDIRSFTDDELAQYIRTLPEGRRDALLVAIQGTSLAGKALF